MLAVLRKVLMRLLEVGVDRQFLLCLGPFGVARGLGIFVRIVCKRLC